MSKLLISIMVLATLFGCSRKPNIENDDGRNEILGAIIPRSLDRLPFIYHPQVQQGNIIEQEKINQLKPGMVKRQVQYVMGSPMLIDVFHQDRWDYYYSVGTSVELDIEKRLTLYFENGRLARIEGDYRPQQDVELLQKKETVIAVPDWEDPNKTILEKAVEAVGIDGK
ncbi:MAG: outer membrane protein assembly factor BamE [bacterium]